MDTDQEHCEEQGPEVSISSMVPALGLLRLESLRSTSNADSDVEEDCSEEPQTPKIFETVATSYREFASAPTKEDDGDGEDSEEDIDGWEDLGATEEFEIIEGAPHPKHNVFIMTIGSRGDIQPFIVLSKQLMEYGHHVRLAGFECFRDFVESNGIEFYPLAGDPRKLMDICVNNQCFSMSFLYESMKFRSFYRELLDSCWEAVKAPKPDGSPYLPDSIISNPPVMAHYHIAEALGIPLHIVFTMPWTRTTEYPHPMVCDRGVGSATYNKWSFKLVESVTFAGLADIVNAWRRSKLHISPISRSVGAHRLHKRKIPHTYCYSPRLSPKPKDWAPHVNLTNFFFLDESSSADWTPPADLDAFLKAGDPPIYVGFGSIPMASPEALVEMILTAVEKTKVRIVLNRGWGMQGLLDETPDAVFVIDRCPHDWLFQHVAAVVHHGGAGTLAAGLAAGKPTGVVAFFGDQFFWAHCIAKREVGAFTTISDVTEAWFEETFNLLLEDKVKQAAIEVGKEIREINGPQETVELFHRFLPNQVYAKNWPRQSKEVFAFEVWHVTRGWETTDITLSDGVHRAAFNKDGKQGPLSVTVRHGWHWLGKWEIEHADDANDPDGWEYSSFLSKAYHPSKYVTDTFRRRCWKRTKVRGPGKCDCLSCSDPFSPSS